MSNNDATPATEKQMTFLVKLLNERVLTEIDGRPFDTVTALEAIEAGMPVTKARVSVVITALLAAPRKSVAVAADTITHGYWVVGNEVYKVQEPRVNGGDRLYGKRLDAETGEWVYQPGVVGHLTASGAVKLDRETAAAYGHLYGRCMLCASPLTDEKSIAQGIGPVCIKKL